MTNVVASIAAKGVCNIVAAERDRSHVTVNRHHTVDRSVVVSCVLVVLGVLPL